MYVVCWVRWGVLKVVGYYASMGIGEQFNTYEEAQDMADFLNFVTSFRFAVLFRPPQQADVPRSSFQFWNLSPTWHQPYP